MVRLCEASVHWYKPELEGVKIRPVINCAYTNFFFELKRSTGCVYLSLIQTCNISAFKFQISITTRSTVSIEH